MAPIFAPRNTNRMMTCDPNMHRFWHADPQHPRNVKITRNAKSTMRIKRRLKMKIILLVSYHIFSNLLIIFDCCLHFISKKSIYLKYIAVELSG